MGSTMRTIVLIFLVINVGVLYYMVLFGDFVEFEQRLGRVEEQLNKLSEAKPANKLITFTDNETKNLPANANEGVIMRLSESQKAEVADLVVGKIDEKIADEVKKILAKSSSPSPVSNSQVKEMFIPFGQASMTTSDFNWKDTALEAEVDMGNYGRVKSVVFEATLRVPSGNGQVEARITANGGAVGGSELRGEGSGGQFRRSVNLGLSGKKTYRVQMRTSLNYEGWMDMGRLKIEME